MATEKNSLQQKIQSLVKTLHSTSLTHQDKTLQTTSAKEEKNIKEVVAKPKLNPISLRTGEL